MKPRFLLNPQESSGGAGPAPFKSWTLPVLLPSSAMASTRTRKPLQQRNLPPSCLRHLPSRLRPYWRAAGPGHHGSWARAQRKVGLARSRNRRDSCGRNQWQATRPCQLTRAVACLQTRTPDATLRPSRRVMP
eukprot:Mycagemm_TRINITY_DN9968_c0_g1::TRINITY_DN9968_c0_g1_i1::g.3485::m.3485 type:complete len:133 gc:universal TRINITY_DN9968_c0_g1_i1:435-833(+)